MPVFRRSALVDFEPPLDKPLDAGVADTLAADDDLLLSSWRGMPCCELALAEASPVGLDADTAESFDDDAFAVLDEPLSVQELSKDVMLDGDESLLDAELLLAEADWSLDATWNFGCPLLPFGDQFERIDAGAEVGEDAEAIKDGSLLPSLAEEDDGALLRPSAENSPLKP